MNTASGSNKPSESAAASKEMSPNSFELQGGGVFVHYSTSSIAGVPLLEFRSPGLEKSFKGNEIRVADTELGKMVSVTLTWIPDSLVNSFSFFIPAFNLGGTSEATFQSVGVRTTDFTSIAGPALVNGPLSAYNALDLAGVAKLVSF